MIENFNELFQDTIYFSFILKLKRNLKSNDSKRYLSKFLIHLSAVYLYEIALFLDDVGVCSKKSLFQPNMMEKVKDERQWLKQTSIKSSKMKNKINSMGINFDELIYDMNIVMKNNNLIDVNFDEFGENNDLFFWNDIFLTIEKIPKIIFEALKIEDCIIKDFDNLLDCESLKYVDIFEQAFNSNRYSYSTYKMFSKKTNLETDDKIFILFRYRLVSSINKISQLFDGVNLNIQVGNYIDTLLPNYLKKLKAIIICIIGNDLQKSESDYCKQIRYDVDSIVEDTTFFKINRKLRNNLHYKNIDKLADEEMIVLNKYQDIYLRFIQEKMEQCMLMI